MELLQPCKAPSVLTGIPRERWHACPCGHPHDSWMFICVSLRAPMWCRVFTRVSLRAPTWCRVFTRVSLRAPKWCRVFTCVSMWAPKRCWVFNACVHVGIHVRLSLHAHVPLGTHTAQPRVMQNWYICNWWGVFFSKHAFMLIIQADTISYILFHRIMMFPKFKVLSYINWNHQVKNKSYMDNNRSHA